MESLATDSGAFEGNEHGLTFTYNVLQQNKQLYYWVGVMVAWSILHQRQGPAFLHPYVYYTMFGRVVEPSVHLSDLPDFEDQEKLRKVTFYSLVCD